MSDHILIIIALSLALVATLVSLGANIVQIIALQMSWEREDAARMKKQEQADDSSL